MKPATLMAAIYTLFKLATLPIKYTEHSPPPSHPGSKLAKTLKTFISCIPTSSPVHAYKLLDIRAFKKWPLLVFSGHERADF